MKRTTMLAIFALVVGVIVIAYFATRPRVPAPLTATSTSVAPGEPTDATRAVTGFGTALTAGAAAIAGLAS